jgi:uncharacterized protein HemX
MLKFLGLLLLVTVSFASGYYFGQRPVVTLQQTVNDLQQSLSHLQQSFKDLSRNALDATTGIEQDLRRRQSLVEAKARVVQARANLSERNFGRAANELTEAIQALEAAKKKGTSDDVLRDVTGSLREVQSEIAGGKPVTGKKLDSIRRRLDHLLNK